MLTTAHLLSGAAVAVVLKDPLLIAPVSFAIHYVLDSVPHYVPNPPKGFKDNGLKGVHWPELLVKSIEPIVGIALVIVLIFLTSPRLRFPIAIGAFFGWLPDFLVFLEWKYDIKRPKIIRFIEDKYHKHAGGIKGILPQSLFSVLCLLFLIVKVK